MEVAKLLQACDGCAWDGHEYCVKRPGQKCMMRQLLSAEDVAYLRKKEKHPEPFYIDRNEIRYQEGCKIVDGIELYGPIDADRDQIMNIPRANVRPVAEARWIEVNNPSFSPFDGSKEHVYLCSNCGKEHGTKSAFCEHCGAVMRGEKRGNENRTSTKHDKRKNRGREPGDKDGRRSNMDNGGRSAGDPAGNHEKIKGT